MGKLFTDRMAVAATISSVINHKIPNGAANIQRLVDGGGKVSTQLGRQLDDVRACANLVAAKLGEMGDLSVMQQQLFYFRSVKNAARQMGAAQCGELAGYVYWRLHRQGTYPISFVKVANVKRFDNHAFVAIGLSEHKGEQEMSNWGEDVVICDPWLNQLLETQGKAKQADKGAYSVSEYIEFTKPYFEDGDSVTVAFSMGKSAGDVPKGMKNFGA